MTERKKHTEAECTEAGQEIVTATAAIVAFVAELEGRGIRSEFITFALMLAVRKGCEDLYIDSEAQLAELVKVTKIEGLGPNVH